MSVVAVVEIDATPPRVRLTVSPGARIDRVVSGVATPVRGVADGAGVLFDYECPQETSVTYTDGLAESDEVEIPNVGEWLIHLGRPELSQQVVFARLPGEDAPSNAATLDIPGGGTIAATFPRSSNRGQFVLNTYTLEEKAALSALLADGSTLFLSTHADVDFGPCYLALGDASWQRRLLGIADKGRRVTLPYVEVQRPAQTAASYVAIDDLTGSIDSLSGTIDSLGG